MAASDRLATRSSFLEHQPSAKECQTRPINCVANNSHRAPPNGRFFKKLFRDFGSSGVARSSSSRDHRFKSFKAICVLFLGTETAGLRLSYRPPMTESTFGGRVKYANEAAHVAEGPLALREIPGRLVKISSFRHDIKEEKCRVACFAYSNGRPRSIKWRPPHFYDSIHLCR